MNFDDRDLIAECLKGRTESYALLVARYQDRLYNAIYRMLESVEDARDVVQEAFLSAYQALASFKGDARFFTWLYRIAMNHAVDLRRKRKVTISLDGAIDDDSQPLDSSILAQPGEHAERNEQADVLRQAMRLLSAEHRAVLVLKDMEDLKYDEIARILRVPIGTVRSRLHRARGELKEILERQEAKETKNL